MVMEFVGNVWVEKKLKFQITKIIRIFGKLKIQKQMENKKLRVRPSDFKTELTFNEWAEKLGISTKCDYDKMEIREYLDKRECADFVIKNGLSNKEDIKQVSFKPTFSELIATYVEKYL